MIKRTLMLLLSGLGVGLVLSMLFGPDLITWWNRPAVAMPFTCDSAIHEATKTLVEMQLGLGAFFGIVAAIGGNWLAMKRAKAAQAPAPAPAPMPELKP